MIDRFIAMAQKPFLAANSPAVVTAVLALVLTFATANPSLAKTVTTSGPSQELMKVLSYNQLMALTPKQREQYVQGLRAMLVELADYQAKTKKSGFFASQEAELREHIAWLDVLFPEAQALGAGGTAQPRGPAQTGTAQAPAASGAAPATAQAGASAPATSGAAAPAAVAATDIGSQIIKPHHPRSLIPNPLGNYIVPKTCGNPDFTVVVVKGHEYCTKKRASKTAACEEGLVPVRQTELGEFLCITRASYNSATDQQRKDMCARATIPDRMRIQKGVPEAILHFNERCPEDGSQIAAPNAPSQVQTASGSDCQVAANACEGVDIPAAQAAYHKEDSPKTCIYAGNVMEYIDGRKTFGNCARPTKFCLGTGGCTPEKRPKFECKRSGDVICNPMLFGVSKVSNEPFCTRRDGAATTNCYNLSKPGTRSFDFLNQNENGIKESWDEFAAAINGLCFPETTNNAKFHCKECSIIRTRLIDLNANLGGEPNACSKANTDWAKVLEGIKRRTAARPAQGAPAAAGGAPAANGGAIPPPPPAPPGTNRQ